MADRRRRYCVYFSRRYVDVFNTFYFVFKNFYFLSKIFYFLSKIFYFVKIFSSVYFFRRPVGVFGAFNFVCKIFNFCREKAKITYVVFEIVKKVRPPARDLAFKAGSSFAGYIVEERRR